MSLQDFDARSVQPQQGMSGHPAGMFGFTITNTYLQENSAKTGAMLVVEFTSDAGRIENRYNVSNPNPQAVEIAQKELSALCHAVNIYQVPYPKNPDGTPNMQMGGHTLRGGRGRMEVAPQTDKQGKPNGYMEVKKVFDVNGNEPGKPGVQPQPQTQPQGVQQQSQPMQQNTNGGWSQGPSAQPQQQPTQQGNPGPAWSNQGGGGQANPGPSWSK